VNAEQFESTLIEFLHKEPFQPFVVELTSGQLIEVNRSRLAIGGGGASFFAPDYDLVEFSCEEVRDIRPIVQGAAS
jgi:hypothetical protein